MLATKHGNVPLLRSVTECYARSTGNEIKNDYAGCIADADSSDLPRLSRSRRRIAFNLPPRSKNKQVRYIHVSRMMIDASAR